MADEKQPFAPPPDHRFMETFGVVRECDHFATHALWQQFHMVMGVPWREEAMGWSGTVALSHSSRPITVCVFWAHIGGRRIAFVDATSQLVDHVLVERWRHAAFPNAKSGTDATNFGNLLQDIAADIGVESLIERETRDLDKLYETLPRNPKFMVTRKTK